MTSPADPAGGAHGTAVTGDGGGALATGPLPPAERYAAAVDADEAGGAGSMIEVRILGDDERGYLLVGHFSLPASAGEEFWFESLDGAIAGAQRLGIEPGAWRKVE